MKRIVFFAVALVVASSAHAWPFKKATEDQLDQKRTKIRSEANNSLEELYTKNTGLKEIVQKAYGYAVFDNTGVNLFLLSTAHGSGVCVVNKTKKETFMCMASLGGGIGLGVKDYRVLFVFKKKEAMDRFISDGWQVGGSADAAAKSGDKGAAVGESGNVSVGTQGANASVAGGSQSVAGKAMQAAPDMEVYQFTKSGIALQATISGTKYWTDKGLNQ